MTSDRNAMLGLDVATLRPVAFGTPDGVMVEAWRSRLPAWFAARLEDDFEGLRRETADRLAASGAGLIDFQRVRVAGRPALRRIERLPEGMVPGVTYAATLIVVHGDGVGVEIAVTCRDVGADHSFQTESRHSATHRPKTHHTGTQHTAAHHHGGDAALTRTRRIAEEITSIIRFPGPASEKDEYPSPGAVPQSDHHISHQNGAKAD